MCRSSQIRLPLGPQMVVDRANERGRRERRVPAAPVHVLVQREAHEEHIDRRLVDLRKERQPTSQTTVAMPSR